MTKLIVAFRNFAKVPTNTRQLDIKNSKKLEECSDELFSATRTGRVLSVLSVGMQMALRIVLQCAVNEKNNNFAEVECQSSGGKTFTLRV
jgi:hypothetical protein